MKDARQKSSVLKERREVAWQLSLGEDPFCQLFFCQHSVRPRSQPFNLKLILVYNHYYKNLDTVLLLKHYKRNQ